MPRAGAVSEPKLVKRLPDGKINIVAYQGIYYRAPVSLGAVEIRAMTPEQTEKVGVFRTLAEAVAGVSDVRVSGKILKTTNDLRSRCGLPRLSRHEAEARLRGADFTGESEIMERLSV